jgi:uncharacterized protein
MAKLEFNKVLRISIVAVSLSVIAAIAVAFFQHSRTQKLTLAAGSVSGESYILGAALKKVVERHYPKIRITLSETGGTVENLRMLEDGRAQLATAQADVVPGPAARMIATLYDDTFQLLVPSDSPIRDFADLRDKRIALAQTGGQFQSFLRVAEHFGLQEQDFRFVGSSDEAADALFLAGQADAIFRVRALGNPSIHRLVQSAKVRFLPIEHAAAIKIKQPAFEPALIPEGAYSGSPAIPAQDLATVAVHRTLVARNDTNEDSIRAVTEVLIEQRQEIMQEIAEQMTEVRLLLAQVRQPQPGLGPPLHAGAISFYNKDKPSFLLAHADYVGLMLTVALMVGSWIWQLKRWMEIQQQKAANQYSNRVVALMSSAHEATSLQALENIQRELAASLVDAVRDLDANKLSEESFHSFQPILRIAMDVTRDRLTILARASGHSSFSQ